MEAMLIDNALAALLEAECPRETVRSIEQGAAPTALWSAIEAAGFCDVMLPEAAGGAALGLAALLPLFERCGRHLVPVPLAQTVLARALLAQHDAAPPAGAIALAAAGDERTLLVHQGLTADWVLLGDGRRLRLLDVRGVVREALASGSLDAWIALPPTARIEFDCTLDLRLALAPLLAAQIAGALRVLMEMSLRHASERRQFGRAIGSFQAVQHQLSVMAQHVEAAAMAARLGCSADEPLADPLHAAVAKAETSAAVPVVTAIAHAVHGAMGITAEFDLQLFTRRLHAWRTAAGTESYWHQRLGTALLDSDAARLPDFVIERLSI